MHILRLSDLAWTLLCIDRCGLALIEREAVTADEYFAVLWGRAHGRLIGVTAIFPTAKEPR